MVVTIFKILSSSLGIRILISVSFFVKHPVYLYTIYSKLHTDSALRILLFFLTFPHKLWYTQLGNVEDANCPQLTRLHTALSLVAGTSPIFQQRHNTSRWGLFFNRFQRPIKTIWKFLLLLFFSFFHYPPTVRSIHFQRM